MNNPSRKTYKLDLTSFDTSGYESNPTVSLNFGNNTYNLIGRAFIAKDKKSVTVNLYKEIPEMFKELAEGFIVKDGKKVLIELSLVVERKEITLDEAIKAEEELNKE